MTTEAYQLPQWIPEHAALAYATWKQNTGEVPSDPRWERAIEALFTSPALERFWRKMTGAFPTRPDAAWAYLVGGIVMSTEVLPEPGTGTRDRPSTKTEIRARQAKADDLRRVAFKLADELATSLTRLTQLGADIPDETYSTRALLERALTLDPMASATCEKPLKQLWRELSSYQYMHFPSPAALAYALSIALSQAPDMDEHFADDPWLSSQKVSIRDYVRVLHERVIECAEMYGSDPFVSLQTADIVVLVTTVTQAASQLPGANEETKESIRTAVRSIFARKATG